MKNIFRFFGTITVVSIILFGCSKPEIWELSSHYRQYSNYKDRNTRAFSLIVKTTDEEILRQIAERYKKKYSDPYRRLVVDFFDDRRSIPDYSKGVKMNDMEEDHLVAHYEIDPFKGLEFFEMR